MSQTLCLCVVQEGFYEDLARGVRTSKVVVAFVSDEVCYPMNTYTSNVCKLCAYAQQVTFASFVGDGNCNAYGHVSEMLLMNGQ